MGHAFALQVKGFACQQIPPTCATDRCPCMRNGSCADLRCSLAGFLPNLCDKTWTAHVRPYPWPHWANTNIIKIVIRARRCRGKRASGRGLDECSAECDQYLICELNGTGEGVTLKLRSGGGCEIVFSGPSCG